MEKPITYAINRKGCPALASDGERLRQFDSGKGLSAGKEDWHAKQVSCHERSRRKEKMSGYAAAIERRSGVRPSVPDDVLIWQGRNAERSLSSKKLAPQTQFGRAMTKKEIQLAAVKAGVEENPGPTRVTPNQERTPYMTWGVIRIGGRLRSRIQESLLLQAGVEPNPGPAYLIDQVTQLIAEILTASGLMDPAKWDSRKIKSFAFHLAALWRDTKGLSCFPLPRVDIDTATWILEAADDKYATALNSGSTGDAALIARGAVDVQLALHKISKYLDLEARKRIPQVVIEQAAPIVAAVAPANLGRVPSPAAVVPPVVAVVASKQQSQQQVQAPSVSAAVPAPKVVEPKVDKPKDNDAEGPSKEALESIPAPELDSKFVANGWYMGTVGLISIVLMSTFAVTAVLMQLDDYIGPEVTGVLLLLYFIVVFGFAGYMLVFGDWGRSWGKDTGAEIAHVDGTLLTGELANMDDIVRMYPTAMCVERHYTIFRETKRDIRLVTHRNVSRTNIAVLIGNISIKLRRDTSFWLAHWFLRTALLLLCYHVVSHGLSYFAGREGPPGTDIVFRYEFTPRPNDINDLWKWVVRHLPLMDTVSFYVSVGLSIAMMVTCWTIAMLDYRYGQGEVVNLTYCPHMVSCLLTEYACGTTPEVFDQTAFLKLNRLGTLNMPDASLVRVLRGTQAVTRAILARPDFFVSGRALGGPER